MRKNLHSQNGAEIVGQERRQREMGKQNTFIIPIIQPTYLERMLFTLYQYTERDSFNVIVIDQTGSREAQDKCEKYAHLWIRPYRNLGFSKAMNTGILLSQTPYITLANDDIEFLHPTWFQGILDTFKQDEKIIAVNPNSPKEGAWGYGLTAENTVTWEAPEGFVRDPEDSNSVIPAVPEGKIASKEWFTTEEGYNYLLTSHPRWQAGTVCDAIAMWCTIFKREGLEEIGLLDERFYPGGGEDYDMNCRAYSCGFPFPREKCDPSFHRRMVGSTRSWVWHEWSKSRNTDASDPIFSRPRWNNNDELWGPKFDVWGHYEDNEEKKPIVRKAEPIVDDL